MDKIKITDLIPYANNARTHSQDQIQKIASSMKEFGFINPVLIDKDNQILAGHGRVEAAKLIGLDEAPFVRVEHLTETQRKAYIIADNQIALKAGWDSDLLRLEISTLEDAEFDISILGFDDLDLGDILGVEAENLEPETDEDSIPKAPPEPITKPGDVWRLGDHLLLCGDSTSVDDVDRLMGGTKADLVFTDPPYGMKKEKDGVLNDNLNFDNLLEFNRQWVPLSFDALKENGSWYCWGIDEPLMDIYAHIIKPLIKANKATFRNLITWDKGAGQGQMSDGFRMYAPADEKCLFIMCGVQGFNNNSDNYFEGWEPVRDYLLKSRLAMGWDVPTMKRIVGHSVLSRDHWTSKSQFNMPTREVYNKMKAEADRLRSETHNDAFLKEYDAFRKEYDELKKEYDELKKEYYSTRAYFNNTHDNMNNVWHFERTPSAERVDTGGHATPKPVALCARAIKTSCEKGGVVLDLFGGSGSTLIACEQLGRSARLIELDPKYCDVIVSRWEKLTNKKATLKNN